MALARALTIGILLTALAPGVAAADGLLIPFVGVNFGGDADTTFGDAFDARRINWGASLAWMGGGVIGFEGDFGYSPEFFGKGETGGGSVISMMGNVLIGVPFGGQQGFGVRPYGLAGIGVLKPEGDSFVEPVAVDDDFKVSWNFGGGVFLFFNSHVGLRGDIRYFRTFDALEVLGIEIVEENDPGDLDFTRGSIGFVFRF